MNLIAKILLKSILYGGLFVLIVSGYVFFSSIRPPRSVSPRTPGNFGMAFEDVTIVSADGTRLAAWYIPAAQPSGRAVVLCHGYPADKGDILGLAPVLHQTFDLLLFDFRAMGKSGGRMTTAGLREQGDLRAAVDWVKRRGAASVGVYGFSMGGAVALMTGHPDVAAVVAESAYADIRWIIEDIYRWFGILKKPFVYATELYALIFAGTDVFRITPLAAIAGRHVPLLLIHSERDSQIPVAHARALHGASPGSELWIAPQAGHGETLDLQEYRDRIGEFFEKHLQRR
ncbi:MAG TPA: alpha/beta hydrolase [bacterium]|nr:alpha/beta hydrolase [bacterium]